MYQIIQRSVHTASAPYRRLLLNIAKTVIYSYTLDISRHIEMSGLAHSWIMTFVPGAPNVSTKRITS